MRRVFSSSIGSCAALQAQAQLSLAWLSPQEAVFRVVAAILSLGNVTFGPGTDEESSVVTPGKAAQFVATTAELLGVDKDGLIKALTTRTRQTPDGPIVSPLDAKAALENRDSLAKILYSKVC